MRCQEFKEVSDSYLGDELLIETNHEILKHLENCPACRQELTARRELRTRLRAAAKNSNAVRINPAFARQLTNNLRETAFRPTFSERFQWRGFFGRQAIFAAACGVFLLLFVGWVTLRKTAAPDKIIASNPPAKSEIIARPAESPMFQAVQIAWRELTDHAVGDHKNCALVFNLAEKPITLDEAAKKYGVFNRDLDKTVVASLHDIFGRQPADQVELLEGHSCVYQGRRFAHVVLKYHRRRVSVLMTDTDLPAENSDITVSQFDDGIRAASFRVAHHAVFVVSDLNGTENSTIAAALLPSVSRHIEQIGA